MAIHPEQPRSGYDRDSFGNDYRLFEDEITVRLPQTRARFCTPYTRTVYDMREVGGDSKLRAAWRATILPAVVGSNTAMATVHPARTLRHHRRRPA